LFGGDWRAGLNGGEFMILKSVFAEGLGVHGVFERYAGS
jgi:hypothetical protein